jgi:Lrp/AsnC family transcriptional regulator, leucine-responsive regulatory protein
MANIDGIDLKILKILQERGKISNIQLSQEIGLSPAPTLERVKKLENSGMIRSYHALVNSSKIGLGFSALIQVSLTRQISNAIRNFTKAVNEIPEIVQCVQLTGNFDYQLTVLVKDIPAFERLIADKLSKIEEIGQMQTQVVLSVIKDSKVLPIEYRERK